MDAEDFDLLDIVLDDQPEPLPGEPSISATIPVLGRNSAPLSSSQERLWFLERLQPGNDSYHIPFGFELIGNLDTLRLKKAIERIIERHAALRCRFVETEDGPQQIVKPSASLEITSLDHPPMSAAESADATKRLLQEQVSLPFDLSRPPLLRVSIIQNTDTKWTVVCVLHHIVSDGWSNTLFIQEMMKGYTDPEAEASAIEVSYLDYAAWQHTFINSSEYVEQMAFWSAYLDGLQDLTLPLDFTRTEIQTGREEKLAIHLSPELSSDLRALKNDLQITTYTLFLSAFVHSLARYTGTQDIALGTPFSGRNHRELEPLIGFFANTLPLRFRLDPNDSFKDLIRNVQESSLKAFSNDSIPFEKLVDHLKPERSLSQHPLVQVTFTVDSPQEPLAFPGIELVPLLNPDQSAKFDLTLAMQDSSDGSYSGSLLCNGSLFAPQSMDAFADLFVHTLETMVQSIDTPIRAELCSLPQNHQKIYQNWGEPETVYERASVFQSVAQQIQASPRAIAVSDNTGSMSYGALGLTAQGVAKNLAAVGLRPFGRVAVVLPRCRFQPAAVLACWLNRSAFVSLDPVQPDQRLQALIESSAASAILTTADQVDRWSTLTDIPVIAVDTEEYLGGDFHFEAPQIHSESNAYIIFTSGSTGHPKGVVVSHRALSNLCAWHTKHFGVTNKSRATQIASPAFDASIWETWPYLATGASLHYPPDDLLKQAGSAYITWLNEQRISHSFAPTPLAEALIQDPESKQLQLKVLNTGGDRLHTYPDSQVNFALHNNYGPTENAVVATSCQILPKSQQRGLPPLGDPVDHCQLYILDQRLDPVPLGAVGTLYIGGESLASHYFEKLDLTAHSFIPHPDPQKPGQRLYNSGDLVRLSADGQLHFLGRADHQIKIRGHRIELGEIEQCLLAHSKINQVAVQPFLPTGAPTSSRMLVAHLGTETDLNPSDLTAWANGRLPAYMVPSRWISLRSLPTNTSGKIDRKSLPEPTLTTTSTSGTASMAETPTQRLIDKLWSALLGRKSVGIDDNFFDLGGHSMLILEVHKSLISDSFPTLKVVDLFTYPTIRELARFLDKPSENITRQSVDAVRSRSDKQREAMKQRRHLARNSRRA